MPWSDLSKRASRTHAQCFTCLVGVQLTFQTPRLGFHTYATVSSLNSRFIVVPRDHQHGGSRLRDRVPVFFPGLPAHLLENAA